MRPVRPGRVVVGSVGLMARLVFTSPFLSPADGISRMGMGAHWSSCPVGARTSVNPSSHMQTPACRGQHTTVFQDEAGSYIVILCSRPDNLSVYLYARCSHLAAEGPWLETGGVTGAVVHWRGDSGTTSWTRGQKQTKTYIYLH